MTSIKDVAIEAGVSTATVSRVLANKGSFKADTRDKILSAIAKLNYRPNLIARSLRVQTSTKIGLLVSDIRNPFFTAIARAVEDAAYARGYSVIMCNTDENPEKEALYLDLMRDENVAGVIFSPTQQFNATHVQHPTHIPFVIIDRTVNEGEFDWVQLDNYAAAYELTEHLLAQGYRKLAGLFGDTSSTGFERKKGFLAALAAHQLEPIATQLMPPRLAHGFDATQALLAQNPRPDAIFTSNSLLTAGAFQALRTHKIAIPQEIGLVGFDETTWSELVEPAITLIAQPTEEIGHSAVELLFQRIQEPERAHRKVILQGTLRIHASSMRNF
ncbi:MAG: transcriptional regulator, LacI family [Burkholderiaceae bacterium]|nr:transcriptional regulator, LacI family [Burkholderiaceae bacterium]